MIAKPYDTSVRKAIGKRLTGAALSFLRRKAAEKGRWCPKVCFRDQTYVQNKLYGRANKSFTLKYALSAYLESLIGAPDRPRTSCLSLTLRSDSKAKKPLGFSALELLRSLQQGDTHGSKIYGRHRGRRGRVARTLIYYRKLNVSATQQQAMCASCSIFLRLPFDHGWTVPPSLAIDGLGPRSTQFGACSP